MKSKDCGQRHKVEDVHDSIERIISQISVSAQTLNLYKKMLEKLFVKNDYMRLNEIERTEKEIEKVKERVINLQDDYMDRKNSPKEFHPMRQKTEKTLTGLELNLKNLKQSTSPFKTFINKISYFLFKNFFIII